MDTPLMAMKDRLTMQLPLKSYPRSPTMRFVRSELINTPWKIISIGTPEWAYWS
ncbi:MAG: hypothetical protein ACLQFI_21685 [Methylocella sp.]